MGLKALRILCFLIFHLKDTRPQNCTTVNGVKVMPVCEERTCNGPFVVISNNATYLGTSVTCSCDVTIHGALRALLRYTSPGYPNCGIYYELGSWGFSCTDAIIHLETRSNQIVFHKTAGTKARSNFELSIETSFPDGMLDVQCFAPSTATLRPKQTTHRVYNTTIKSNVSTKSVESVSTSTMTSSITSTSLEMTTFMTSHRSTSTKQITTVTPSNISTLSNQTIPITTKNGNTQTMDTSTTDRMTETTPSEVFPNTANTSYRSTSTKPITTVTPSNISTLSNQTMPTTTRIGNTQAMDTSTIDRMRETTSFEVSTNTAKTPTSKSSTTGLWFSTRNVNSTPSQTMSTSYTPVSSTTPIVSSSLAPVPTTSLINHTSTDISKNITQQASKSSSTISRRVLTWSVAGSGAGIFVLTIIVITIVMIRKRRVSKRTLSTTNSSYIDAFNNFTYETPNLSVAGDNTQDNNTSRGVVLGNHNNTPSDWSISSGSAPVAYNWDSPEEDETAEVDEQFSHSDELEDTILLNGDNPFETVAELRQVYESDNSFCGVNQITDTENDASEGDIKQEPEHVNGPVNSDIYAIVTKRNAELQFERYVSPLRSFKIN